MQKISYFFKINRYKQKFSTNHTNKKNKTNESEEGKKLDNKIIRQFKWRACFFA